MMKNKLLKLMIIGFILSLSLVVATSTKLTLQTADTENLNDARVYLPDTTTNYGIDQLIQVRDSSLYSARTYIMFNISMLPEDISIDEAYFGGFSESSDTGQINYIYHVYRTNWTEGSGDDGLEVGECDYTTNITWANQPCGSSFDNSDNCNLTSEDSEILNSGWEYLSIKNMIEKEYNLDTGTISFVLKTAETNSYSTHYMKSKEDSNVTTRPRINITYSTTPPVVSLINPINNYASKNTSYTFSCNATDGTDLANLTLWTDISGTWAANYTQNATGVDNKSVSLSYVISNIDSGTYKWNCLGEDDAGYSAWASSNNTLSVTTLILDEPDVDILNDAQTYTKSDGSYNWSVSGTCTSLNVRDNTGYTQRAYLMYNISKLPEDIIIDTANYYGFLASTSTTLVSVYEVYTINWTEGTECSVNTAGGANQTYAQNITWANQPCGGYGFDNSDNCNLTAETTKNTVINWNKYSIKEMVQRVYSEAIEKISFVLKSPETGSKNTEFFRSKEHTNLTTLPYLNITYTIDMPVSTLNDPTNGMINYTNTHTFSCNATDGTDLANLTLWTDISGTWAANYTQNATGVDNKSVSLSYVISNIDSGTYKWNCLATDDFGHTTWGSSNFTFDIDTTNPLLHSKNTLPVTMYNNYSMLVNISSTDTHISTVWLEINATGTWINHSMDNVSDNYYITIDSGNFSNQLNITYRFHANDSLGNTNVTDYYYLFVENRAPNIPTQYSPSNDTKRRFNNIFINYSSTDDDGDSLTYYLYSRNSSSSLDLIYEGSTSSYNYTNIFDESYFWYIKVGDGYDNSSNSSTLTFTIDTTAPTLNLTNPLNNTVYTDLLQIPFQWYTYDLNGLSTCWYWDSIASPTNTTISCTTNDTLLNTIDYGTHNFIFYVNDTVGNEISYNINYTNSLSVPGGGGSSTTIIQVTNVSTGPVCGDGVCDFIPDGYQEDVFSCPQDCRVDLDSIMSGDLFQQAWFIKIGLLFLGGIILITFISESNGKKKKTKKNG